MEEEEQQQLQTKQLLGAPGCYSKSIFKCCLFYFTALLILTLIFTGANNEPKDALQTKWWWAFIISLLATASMSATALALLIYTDYYKSFEPNAADDTQPNASDPTSARLRPGRKITGYDMPDSLKTVVSISVPRNNTNVADNYLGKTTLEEPTTDTNRLLPSPPPQPVVAQIDTTDMANGAAFVNLTPGESSKSPVTVVDMTTARRKAPERSNRTNQRASTAPPRKRLEEPSNLASVVSRPIQDNKKRKRKRGPKKKLATVTG